MLNAFQTIFGGSDTSSTSSSTPTNMNPFTSSLAPQINQMASQGVPQYNGQLVAPTTANQNSLLSTLMTQQGQGGGTANTNSTLSGIIGGSGLQGNNPLLTGSIAAAQAPTNEGLATTLSQSLPSYFTANGQFVAPNNNGQGGSSAFDNAAALATQSAANADAQIAGNIGGQAYTAGVNQQTQALQLSQQEVQNTISNLNAQALPQAIAQMGIQNGLQLYQTNVSSVLSLLQTLGGIAQPVIGNTATSTSTGESQGNMFASLFPASSGGGGSGGSTG